MAKLDYALIAKEVLEIESATLLEATKKLNGIELEKMTLLKQCTAI